MARQIKRYIGAFVIETFSWTPSIAAKKILFPSECFEMTNLLTFKVNYRVESLLKKIKMYLYNVNMYEKGKWKKIISTQMLIPD